MFKAIVVDIVNKNKKKNIINNILLIYLFNCYFIYLIIYIRIIKIFNNINYIH